MFENGIFGLFKSSNKDDSAPQQTWNPNTMTMEQPTNYAANKQEVVTEQPVRAISSLVIITGLNTDVIYSSPPRSP